VTGGPLGGPAVHAWLDELRQRLDREAATLRGMYPACGIRVLAHDVGARTELQGRLVALEVTLEDGEAVALGVTAAYLTTLPRLDADVSWSHGNVEAATWESTQSTEWQPATADNIAALERDLPRLIAALHAAIARGRPRRKLGADPISS
jgi:hypothetical protein